MNNLKEYNAEATTSPIQTMSGPVRDLTFHLMLRGFSTGVVLGHHAGLQIRPLTLRAADVIGQVPAIVIDFESLETILPDALERFGLTGTRIAWDFISENVRAMVDSDVVVRWTRVSFDDWMDWSREVRLLDGEGRVIPTEVDLGEGDIYHEDLVREPPDPS